MVMVFNTTFKNIAVISWQSVLLVDDLSIVFIWGRGYGAMGKRGGGVLQ
jgi:hypothetical protein